MKEVMKNESIMNNMKECYKVFFATDGKGITSTAANHAANKAKEMLKHKQSMLDNIKFINTSVSLLSGGEEKALSTGISTNDLMQYHNILDEIGKTNAMIAWLREAIKAKDAVFSDIRNTTLEYWAEKNGKVVPTPPERTIGITSSEVIGSWDENKRARYYALDAYTSLLGKWIHPKGAFYEAKKDMDDKIANPRKIEGSGRDAVIYTYEMSLLSTDVDIEYKNLAETLRRKEAEYNKMKAEIDKTVDEDNIRVTNKYNKEYDAYRKAYASLRAEFDAWKATEEMKAKELKIRMPESVKETYDTI